VDFLSVFYMGCLNFGPIDNVLVTIICYDGFSKMICIYKSSSAEIVNWGKHSMSNIFSAKKILIAFGEYNFNDFKKSKIEISRKYRIDS
jgi:hypothetical protein